MKDLTEGNEGVLKWNLNRRKQRWGTAVECRFGMGTIGIMKIMKELRVRAAWRYEGRSVMSDALRSARQHVPRDGISFSSPA